MPKRKGLYNYLFDPIIKINRVELNLIAIFFLTVGLIFGTYLTLTKLWPRSFATTQSTQTRDTATQFSQGTTSSTTVSGSGATAVVQLSGAAGPDNTLYKRPITITNTGGALTNYQVLITLDTTTLINASKLQSNCADIRFNDTDDSTDISNYYVDTCNSATTRIWVKVPSIAATPSTTTIYLYYGSSSASAVSSFVNTFTQANTISGIQVWFKADSITGLSDDAAITTWD